MDPLSSSSSNEEEKEKHLVLLAIDVVFKNLCFFKGWQFCREAPQSWSVCPVAWLLDRWSNLPIMAFRNRFRIHLKLFWRFNYGPPLIEPGLSPSSRSHILAENIELPKAHCDRCWIRDPRRPKQNGPDKSAQGVQIAFESRSYMLRCRVSQYRAKYSWIKRNTRSLRSEPFSGLSGVCWLYAREVEKVSEIMERTIL